MYLFHEPTLIDQAKHFPYQMLRLDLTQGEPRRILITLMDRLLPLALSMNVEPSSYDKIALRLVYAQELYRIKKQQVEAYMRRYQPYMQAFYNQAETQFNQLGFSYIQNHEAHRFYFHDRTNFQSVHFRFPHISIDSWYDFERPSKWFSILFLPNETNYDLFAFLEAEKELRKTYGRKRGLAKEWDRLIGPLTQIAEMYKQTLIQIEQETGAPMESLYERHPKSPF